MSTFRQRVLDVVRSIPPGKVATYGQVALLAGNMHAARQVGAVLYGISEAEDDVPWQRVINASGGISTFKVGVGELQVALLTSEGVEVHRTDAGPRVALRQWQWRPDIEPFGLGPETEGPDTSEE
jgi:methylated-DNA-protein-cysteine methyltransferase-like protein